MFMMELSTESIMVTTCQCIDGVAIFRSSAVSILAHG